MISVYNQIYTKPNAELFDAVKKQLNKGIHNYLLYHVYYKMSTSPNPIKILIHHRIYGMILTKKLK